MIFKEVCIVVFSTLTTILVAAFFLSKIIPRRTEQQNNKIHNEKLFNNEIKVIDENEINEIFNEFIDETKRNGRESTPPLL